ncbi:hypothetical protein BTO06_18170 [Tenacibaculum sp. SZ-18]|uniref:collagen-like triple helix repeat-containing protein n=1 Tax=Tenacibaculum sp. SZ-18 TaxID=754423 RepID=UPI000C2D35F8|nr:collagen-like protein [Tenacibaculum sp. SZ-18]AUC16955.1 hypothetical protein BTO06_18170 [Tenacibaculum sp. SZ-18]
MITIHNTIKLSLAIIFSLIIFSCSGEDGEQGIEGPQGEQGVTGDTGPQGEAGSANVFYSDWITANYTINGAQVTNLMGLDVLTESELNPDTDVVLVYGRTNESIESRGIYALPYFFSDQNEYYTFGLFEGTNETGIQVRVSSTDSGTKVFTFFMEYRYVIIKSSQSISARQKSEYAKMSFNEIKEKFNIY